MARTPPNQTPPHRRAWGERLKQLRVQAGLNQTEAAAAAGMNRSAYADVEAARSNATVDRVFDIARGLGIDPADLFTDLSQRDPH